jgi:hypothetical protein
MDLVERAICRYSLAVGSLKVNISKAQRVRDDEVE